ncbi:MAG: CsgG/HfaB family protein [Elusimicrobiota bacterium]
MKRLLLIILLILTHINLTYAIPKENDISNIAIAEFEAKNVSAMDASAISDFVRTAFVNSKLFKVLDRINMSAILEEQKFQMSGCTTQECAVKMGKILNVQKIIIGNLTKLADLYFITASVIDVETGQILISERKQTAAAENLVDIAEELGRMLALKLKDSSGLSLKLADEKPRPRTTRIEKKGKEVFINRGILDRVQKKDIYDIYDGDDKIAKILITNVDKYESKGETIKSKANIESDLPANYVGRWRTSCIGVLGNIVSGGNSFFLDYDIIYGWGIQLNTGYCKTNVREGESIYRYPSIIKRNFNSASPVSQYIGTGICQSKHIYGSHSSKKMFDTILFCGGLNIQSSGFFRLICDGKIILGGNFEGYNTNLLSISLGLGLSW